MDRITKGNNLTHSAETSQDSGPESTGDRMSSDSWEKIPSNDGHHVSSVSYQNEGKDASTRPGDSFHKVKSGSPNAEIAIADDNSQKGQTYEELKGGYHSEYSKDVPLKMHFDPKSSLENRVFKPIQQILYRKKTVSEKSSLVKHAVQEYDDDEVIMPEFPDASNGSQNLPDGIGTGQVGDHFGYSELNAEKKQASTYADAAKGLLMSFLGAGVMYGITAVLVRLAGQEGIDPIAVMFIRSVFQAVVFGSTLLYKRTGWRPPPGRAIRCLWISVVYCIASISSYEAFDVIPPGSAVATRGAARTIFSIIFAFLILREGVSIGDILGLLCCFGGIALIITSGLLSGDKDYIQPPGLGDNATTIRIYGYTLLIISAIGRSIGHVGVRGARDDLNTFTIVFYHSSLTVIMAGILLATVRTPTSPFSWVGVAYIAVICVASSIATYASNQAVKYAHPALVSFGQNADVAVSLTLEHILIARSPQPMELSGVLTIFLGLCGLTLYKWRKSKEMQQGLERLS